MEVSIFLLLCHWRKADKWEDVSLVMRQGHVWCVRIYCAAFLLISLQEIGSNVRFHQIIPLLEDWSGTMVVYTGCCPDILILMDGEPWKMAKPRTGDAAYALIRAARRDEVNQVQQAFIIVTTALQVQK
jgi:hypothetical protein